MQFTDAMVDQTSWLLVFFFGSCVLGRPAAAGGRYLEGKLNIVWWSVVVNGVVSFVWAGYWLSRGLVGGGGINFEMVKISYRGEEL